METTKTSNSTFQLKSFISIFFTCQVSACEQQPFSCHDLANDIYSKLPKLCSATLIASLFSTHRHFISSHMTFLEDMEVYGIAVLSFFSSCISVILILMSGIAVSSSPAVCGFSSFWLTVLGKRRSFLVLRYRSFGLSCLM